MFTGIITHTVAIASISSGTFRVTLDDQCVLDELTTGQSIAHDGACMTVTDIYDDGYSFFVMQESFNKTALGDKQVGDQLNIELCMRADTRLDGHIVTGHIDTTAQVQNIVVSDDGSTQLEIAYQAVFDQLVVPKGSIAIQGVALTVVDVGPGLCSVWLIPETLARTNLSDLHVGSRVHVEFDLLAKYVTRYGRE